MANLMDHIAHVLWDEIIGRDETHLKVFDMANAWKFFVSTAAEHPKAKRCALSIELKGSKYIISQLLMTAEGEVIKANSEFYLGRQIEAELIDDSVVEYMAGESLKLMDLPY